MKLTLELFRQTGRDCDDIAAAVNDETPYGAGRVYCDNSLFIEDTTTWKDESPADQLDSANVKGRWYVMIGNREYRSDDLTVIEQRLFEFALSEGYLDEPLRQRLIKWHCWNDRNGVWTDEDRDCEEMPRMTLTEAIILYCRFVDFDYRVPDETKDQQ